jgi:hypothetical protein
MLSSMLIKFRFSKNLLPLWALCLVLILCSGGYLGAQMGVATISGVVTDPSGSLVPGAKITLESETEKASRDTVTNSSGEYVIPAIPPGTYKLTVNASGLKSQTLTGVNLTSGQGSTLNVALTLSQAFQEVTVTQAPPLLETTTATIGAVIDSRQFTELPQLGRNFTTMIDILPGVANIPGPDASYAGSGVNNAAVVPSLYGQRQRDNDFTLDGATNVTPNFSRIGMIPPPEAIQEMKVSSGTDSGAFGWASGANINIVTRSGTSEFHGDAWEFLRNSDLNARSYFIPKVGAFHFNQFGVAAGGPLMIPHILSKNKGWYVYGWYEGIRIHQAANNTSLVPTSDQLNGDFSAGEPIFNPYSTVVAANGTIASRSQFAGNQIPASQLNPDAVALAKALYPAPNSSGIPGVNYVNTTSNTNTSDQWSGRVDHQFSPNDNFYARYSDWINDAVSSTLPTMPLLDNQHYTNIVGSETHLFSPSFLFTARFAVMRFTETQTTGGPDVAQSTGLVSVFPAFRGKPFLPPFSIAGYASLSQSADLRGPEYYLVPTIDFQKVVGRHAFAFGGGYTNTSFLTDQTHGGENFSSAQTAFGSGTGDGLASFLLGLPFTANRVGGPTAWTFNFHTYSWYVQDTFRFNPKLTFNYGLRWDYMAPMSESPGLGTLDIDTGVYLWDHTNPITGQPANLRSGGVEPDYRGYQPRFGIAYQLAPKTVLRSSFGIFDDMFGANQQSPTGTAGNWPFAFPQTLASVNATVPNTFLQNPFPGPPVGSAIPLGCAQCQNVDKNTTRNPYVEEWSLSLQQQITPALKAEANYVGSHGVKLMGQLLDNLATVPGVTPIAQRTPWPNFPPFVNNGFNEYKSSYNGLVLKLDKQYSRNLLFLFSYTWSKTMDQSDGLGDGGIYGQPSANPTRYGLSQFYGPAGYNVRQRVTASYFYDIPGRTGNRLLDAVVAHWQTSGIVSGDNGVPFFVYLTTDNENIGTASFGSPRYTEFPNLVCDPNAGFHRTAAAWFNTSCDQLPQFGTAGNAGRHALYSQGLVNWDASINKQWPLGETKNVQFRAESFNLTNSATFDPPGVLFGTVGFGKVSATTRQPGRQIQLALKFHF